MSLRPLGFVLLFIVVFAALRAAMRAVIDRRLRRRNLFVLFMHKGGMGDAFCQTGLMRAMRARHPEMRFIVFTRYPEFFWYLHEVESLIDMRAVPWLRAKMLYGGLRLLGLARAHDFVYRTLKQTPKAKLDANPGWRPHLVELAATKLRVPADFSDVRGLIRFSQEERKTFAEKYAGLGDYAIVVPSGKTSYTPNKEWGAENYAAVVASMPEVKWVRLGLAGDPEIPGTVDLRGKTSVREMAWLLFRARFALCGEGLHNHLCGGLGARCFVIRTGFNYDGISAYPKTVHIAAPQEPPCAPCFLKTPCPVAGRPCASDIRPARVVAILREALGNHTGV